MLKGRDPFLSSLIHEEEKLQILPSAIQAVLHWCLTGVFSVHCAYILAMINCHDNAVTNGTKSRCIYLRRWMPKTKSIKACFNGRPFWGFPWLIQSRLVNIHVKCRDPTVTDWCFIYFASLSVDFLNLLKWDTPDRYPDQNKESILNSFRRRIYMIYWTISLQDRANQRRTKVKGHVSITA